MQEKYNMGTLRKVCGTSMCQKLPTGNFKEPDVTKRDEIKLLNS